MNPSAKAFVFRRNGTSLGHENEVLFASGLRLQLHSNDLIRPDYPAINFGYPDKRIPAYVFEVDLS
ncbi:hypothetical protein [Paraburkholderia sp. BL17N1]|uniref:hypothetical protein n=1 Tax=Paraburkholderia sp. BL17N1 TaxID=1938798 RepID=UPI0011C3C706|nr:hypothetical protein [Paraburkholderia sp. BL17N1]